MHTGARARKQKYISIYISLYMKTFLKTGIHIYIYIYICIENTSLNVYEEKMCKFVIVFSSLPKRSHFVSGFQ